MYKREHTSDDDDDDACVFQELIVVKNTRTFTRLRREENTPREDYPHVSDFDATFCDASSNARWMKKNQYYTQR